MVMGFEVGMGIHGDGDGVDESGCGFMGMGMGIHGDADGVVQSTRLPPRLSHMVANACAGGYYIRLAHLSKESILNPTTPTPPNELLV